MRDADGMYGEEPAHMKDSDVLAKDWSDSERKYAKQVADLQAKNHALESEVLQDNAALRRQAQEIVERGKQNFALQAEVERLLTALLAVEWVVDRDDDSFCPWCGRYRDTDNGRHRSDCGRQIALGLAEVAQ